MSRGRCILCGREHEVDPSVQISEDTGKRATPDDVGPFWKHACDHMEATVCDFCHGDPEKIVSAHRLLTAVGAILPTDRGSTQR